MSETEDSKDTGDFIGLAAPFIILAVLIILSVAHKRGSGGDGGFRGGTFYGGPLGGGFSGGSSHSSGGFSGGGGSFGGGGSSRGF